MCIVYTYPGIGKVDYIPITVYSLSLNNIPQMSSFPAIVFYGFRNVLDIFPVTGNRWPEVMVICGECLWIITKPGQRHLSNHIKLQTTKYVIEQTQKIKVLVIFITSGFSNLSTINNIISKVNYRLLVLREVFKYSVYHTKNILTNSIILSVIRYASPILNSSSTNHLSKLQVIIMKCSRPILGI